MGPFFPWSTDLKRGLRILLRTDFHLLCCLFAHFIGFCRKSDVHMGQEKYYEGWYSPASNGKHNVYRVELGRRPADFLHNESYRSNNIRDWGWIDVDSGTWGGHSIELGGRRENSGVH